MNFVLLYSECQRGVTGILLLFYFYFSAVRNVQKTNFKYKKELNDNWFATRPNE